MDFFSPARKVSIELSLVLEVSGQSYLVAFHKSKFKNLVEAKISLFWLFIFSLLDFLLMIM